MRAAVVSFGAALTVASCSTTEGGTSTAGAGGAMASSSIAPSASSESSSSSTSSTGGGGGSEPGRPFAYVGSDDGKIRVFSVDLASGALAPIQTVDAGQNPSFLAFAPDHRGLYAVDENASQLLAFALDPNDGTLSFLNQVSSNGSGPAHVAVDPSGGFVFGVNYGSGDVTMVRRNADQSLGATVATLSTGANAHQIVFDPSSHFAFVPDKGSDDIAQLVFDAKAPSIGFNSTPSTPMPGGSGPRHIVFHRTAPFAYVIRENDDKVTALAFDTKAGTLMPIQTLSTLPNGVDGAANTCAEIAFGASGKFLYGSNRGDDSIAIFSVDAGTGMMTAVGHAKSGGATPRHFSIDATSGLMLVANQGSGSVVTFRIDAAQGTLTALMTTAVSGHPAFAGILDL